MSTITQNEYAASNGGINLTPIANQNPNAYYDEENIFDDAEDKSVEKIKQRKPLKAVLSSPSIRVILFLSLIFFVLAAWAIIALVSSDNKISNEKSDGVNIISIDPKTIDKTNINKDQAKHLMLLQQQEAERLSNEGKSNAAALAIQSDTKDRALDKNLAMGEFSTIGMQTQGRRQAAPGENLTDSLRYEQSSDPKTGRIIYIEKSSNMIIDPLPNSSFAQATYQTNANSGGSFSGGNGVNGSNNGNYNNGGGNGGSGNVGTNNNQDQSSQYNQATQNTQNPQPQQQQQAQPRQPDEDITRLEQQSTTGYQAYLDQQQSITQQMQQEQQNRVNAAQQLAQQRQQLANQSITNALQRLNIGRSSQGGFAVVPYMSSDYNSSSSDSFKGVPYANGQLPTNPYDDSINGLSRNPNKTNVSDLTASGRLPSHIIRAGTTWGVVIENTVNSDNAGYVIGRLTSGKFAGSKVYGSIEPSGRNIGISFTAIQPPASNRPLIPVNAIAMTIGAESSVASKVNRHYTANYGTMLLTSIIGGIGQGYAANANSGTTTISPTGVVVQDNSKNDLTQQIRGQVYSQLAAQLQSDIARFGARPPTFIINQGTPLQMVLLSNLDTKASTDNLGELRIGGFSSNGSNRNGEAGQQLQRGTQTQTSQSYSNY